MSDLSPAAWNAIAVATVTLAGVAFGRLPWVPLDRSGFALVGSVANLIVVESARRLGVAIGSGPTCGWGCPSPWRR